MISINKEETLISVIVPVFNIAAELPFCTHSILQQTYPNFELLLIDDGSTDGGSEICDELATKDARIRVIHQGNAGVSVARNTGIENAKGEYIAFIDGDDIIATNYLEVLLSGMKEQTALSMCSHMRISAYDQIPSENTGDIHFYKAKECAKKLLSGRFPISACCCLMRRRLLGEIYFPSDIRSNEDKLFLYRYLLNNEDYGVTYTNDQLYGYYVREGSASKSSWNGSKDIIRVADEIESITITKHPEWEREAKDNSILARLNTLKSIILSNKETEEDTRAFRCIRRETLEKGWPKTTGNRTKVEYVFLRAGARYYKFLVKIFYFVTSDEKRYKTNEKTIRQS